MKEELTTLMLSITVDDKVWLMQRAAEERTTAAAILRGWIAEKRSAIAPCEEGRLVSPTRHDAEFMES